MVGRKWKDKIPLDADGLRVLGVALYLGLINAKRNIIASNYRQNAAGGIPLCALDELEAYDEYCKSQEYVHPMEDFTASNSEINRWRVALRNLGMLKGDVSKAKLVTLESFRFEWHHLYQCPNLPLHLKANLPKRVKLHYPIDLIISQSNLSVVDKLREMWFEEVYRVVEKEEGLTPRSLTDEEYYYSLLVSDICGAPQRRGHSRGQRNEDDRAAAVEFAVYLVMYQNYSNYSAARRAVVIKKHGSSESEYFLVGTSEDAKVSRIYENLLKFQFPVIDKENESSVSAT